jgi:hypothetical protein
MGQWNIGWRTPGTPRGGTDLAIVTLAPSALDVGNVAPSI